MNHLYTLLGIFVFGHYFLKARKGLHLLQLNFYNENNRYLKWIFKNIKIAFSDYSLIGIITLIPLFIIKNEVYVNILLIINIIFFAIAIYKYLLKLKNEQTKKKLVTTARVKRLWVTLVILYLIPLILLFKGNDIYKYVILLQILMTGLAYFIVYIANTINVPVENLVTLKFHLQAQKKLRDMPNLKVVGITGSYGKTSSKNILNEILSVKYISKPTHKNFNTYKGLMFVINSKIEKFDEIFIAEMGAFARGDIKQLVDFVHPKYGILTTIGTAHLESFGSRENIQKTKFELIEGLPSDGLGVLNKDDEYQTNYELKNNVPIKWIAIDDKTADYYADDIKCTNEGTTFNLRIKGDNKKYPFTTKLLGKFNVYNILASIALGIELGINIELLQVGVKRVKPVEHRLELKRLGNFYQIDDAYNSNPVGAKMALEVLDMMPGTKVIVTPGMIDLGKEEDNLNREFGRQIKEVADYVILVGEKKTKPIYEGLIEAGYKKDKIIITNNVVESYNMLEGLKQKNKELYALYENDLPDSYNE